MVSMRPLSLVSLLLGLAAAASPAQTFVFHLDASQEVPPAASAASGGCMGELDQGTATFELSCVHSVVGPTIMHIHRGAPGVTGAIAFDLGDPTSPVVTTWSGMTPADIADLLAGDLYLNIHTSGRPDGEIRGQILTRTVDTVLFTADGSQMVPPGAAAGSATCSADLDAAATGLAVQCTHSVAAPISAHIHEAPAGQNGPVVFTFPSPASPLGALAPMTPLLVADFAATFLYLEIHTAAMEGDPDADIRGQIGTPPAAPSTGSIRIVKSSFPAGGTGFAFSDDVPGSSGSFTLDDGQAQTFSSVAPGTYTVTEADSAATPGGFALAHVECSDSDSSGDRFAGTATIRLQAGESVTCTFQNLQLAGAALPFVFHLSGAQEVPPAPSSASGGCAGFLDSAGAQFTLVCTHDIPVATIMHIHRAPAGQNGEAVFDLGDPASPVLATWTGMSPADIADLLAGNLYLNIHTGGRPAGEIRGQILPRTRDSFDFGLDGAQQVPPVVTAASGRCFADLNDAANALALECSHTLANPTAAHIHQAPAGENGPVLIHLGSSGSPFALDAPLTPRDVADLVAGFLYVNIHSDFAPDGEIRGQIVDGLALGPLSIPALGPWAMVVLGLALVLAAVFVLRRQRRSAGG